MNRRRFVHAAGLATLGLCGEAGLPSAHAAMASLLSLLEDSPRERLPGELAKRIREGLRYEDLLTALCSASARNVQPYPDVGFKYHAVMVLRSIHAATQNLPADDRWLPILWAADYFKSAQAQERSRSGWQLPTRQSAQSAAPTARHAFITALDHWDRDAADAAIVDYASFAPIDAIFALLFRYGMRDLREIGHKAIAVSNAHRLMGLLGTSEREAMLRSTVAALQNFENGPNPVSHDLPDDRPWRENTQQLRAIPQSWKQGRDDPSARTELREALYVVSPRQAGAAVVTALRHGLSPEAVWRVHFGMATELMMQRPNILSVHAQTTANALHYIYRSCGEQQTEQLALLQCAAYLAMFRELTGASATSFELDTLPPHPLAPNAASIDALYADVSAGRRLEAASKVLGYLQGGGDPAALIATARHNVVYYAEEPHDYKFPEAVFDNYAQLPDGEWRQRFLSVNVAHFTAPARQPSEIVRETLERLQL
jgi:hypothetical protein